MCWRSGDLRTGVGEVAEVVSDTGPDMGISNEDGTESGLACLL
jgi:hypothetical protein